MYEDLLLKFWPENAGNVAVQLHSWHNTICAHVYHLFACCTFYYKFILLCFATHIIHILPSLRGTSAPIHLTSVLGVLGTQETSCILVAGLLERDHLQPLLP